MERVDLGPGGSYGGKIHDNDLLINQPLIIVHGVSDMAGDRPTRAANWFKKHGGYKQSELYSTTYFNGAQGNPLKWLEYTMKCEYVKQVRSLIVAVRLYTGRQVDVIGYSLGVPVSRKAILGGHCVDTGEHLGGPLTKFVNTYVGAAGPNHGIAPQMAGIQLPACALGALPICNSLNGLYSGNCPQTSRYLQDINAYQRYEGQHIYTIYSRKDQVVGYLVCGAITSQIAGQDGGREFDGLNHAQTFHSTHHVQLRMIRDHKMFG
ncbi:unnamed protein product, partial [Mesorhabditis belari]|uniref:Triacylglycerol lipase n=1 Tax=Mesorhabditis belari TaxID=2138241 RepID=A0AAF3EJQ9_9BILA